MNPVTAETEGGSRATVVSLADVVVNEQLLCRPAHMASRKAEVAAMHSLAGLLPAGSARLLKRLADLAIELCGADSSGVSILEGNAGEEQVFRWRALAGELAPYEGGATPREWSPCGQCLNAGKPMLYAYPARYFTYFQDVDTCIVEGLVIPMQAAGSTIGTIWIISNNEGNRFDAEDVRVMSSLGAFATAAMRFGNGAGAFNPEDSAAEREVVWRECLRRIALGDLAALELLMAETRPFLFASALRVLGCPADAEETTADVYLQVTRIGERYDVARQTVLAWLLNLARSRAIDRLRALTRYSQSIESALSVRGILPEDPETSATRGQIANQIRRAMQVLPPEQKRAIELAYFEGYSVPEIAIRQSQPLGTVKSRIRKGLIALRLLLASQASSFEGRPGGPGETCPPVGLKLSA